MRKKAAAQYCGDCGYEIARDDTGECRICARLEQLREESAVLRPNELAYGLTRPRKTNDSGPGPSMGWRPTPAEYRAILAARRLSKPSAQDPNGRPAASVIGTPAFARPAISALEPPAAALASGSTGAPKKTPAGRHKSAQLAPTPMSPNAPTPGLIRLNAEPRPADLTLEGRSTPLNGKPPPVAEESQPRRKSLSTLPPRPDDGPSISSRVDETAALAIPRAHRVLPARANGHHGPSADRGYPWKTAFWVAAGGGILAAAVALLPSMIR